jgi:hypothetical protein
LRVCVGVFEGYIFAAGQNQRIGVDTSSKTAKKGERQVE